MIYRKGLKVVEGELDLPEPDKASFQALKNEYLSQLEHDEDVSFVLESIAEGVDDATREQLRSQLVGERRNLQSPQMQEDHQTHDESATRVKRRRHSRDSDEDIRPVRRRPVDADDDDDLRPKRLRTAAGVSTPQQTESYSLRRRKRSISGSDSGSIRHGPMSPHTAQRRRQSGGDKDRRARRDSSSHRSHEYDEGHRPGREEGALAETVDGRGQDDVPRDSNRRESNSGTVIFRDAEGRKATKSEYMERQTKRKNRVRVPRPKLNEADLEWGGGIKQKEDLTARAAYEAEVAKGPIQRHDIDESLDKEMREKYRWEDPLLKMEGYDRLDQPSGEDEELTENVRRFAGPPNRFGIQPGKRWDGRIRGNGFEQRFLAAKSEALSKPSIQMYSAMD